MLHGIHKSAFVRLSGCCVDRAHGGYVERFGWDGAPIDPGFKRTRVLARQCYVFSQVALGGVPEAHEAARVGAEFLLQRARREDGQFVSVLASDGTVLDPAADLYDIAFALFAMAWWFRLTGDARVIGAARRSLAHLDRHMRSPTGLGFLSREGAAGGHHQNPHMHLFEALVFLCAFTGQAAARAMADELFALARNVLIDPQTGTLAEEFGPNWQRGDSAGDVRIEPGHHYEWAWLLTRYGALAAEPRALALADGLFIFARRHGHDPVTGLIVDALDQYGRVMAGDLRIWPNLEYIKALVAMRERGDGRAAWCDVELALAARRVSACFLTRQDDGPAAALPDGLWIDYLHGGTLKPKCDHVPASTLYHITCAYCEAMRHAAGHDPFSGLPW